MVARALTYIKFFPVRFTAKFLLFALSLATPLILPWPIKIVIDNVILQKPVDPRVSRLFRPFVRLPRRYDAASR